LSLRVVRRIQVLPFLLAREAKLSKLIRCDATFLRLCRYGSADLHACYSPLTIVLDQNCSHMIASVPQCRDATPQKETHDLVCEVRYKLRSSKRDDDIYHANHRSPCSTRRSSTLISGLVCLFLSGQVYFPFTLNRVHGLLRQLKICRRYSWRKPDFE